PKRDLPELVERCLRRAALWDEGKDRLRTPAAGASGGQQARGRTPAPAGGGGAEWKARLAAPATGLCGGQQQRLCIARTLGNEPEVLLMDEPCSALDPIATQRIEELIVELQRDYTIVIG